jgi:N-acetylglucosaminyldiphosphoundecaprenol N-acetyl-beta-D-mannosaminyltransferase
MLYGKKIERRSFDMTSVAPQLFDYAMQNNKSVYIVASKQEQVEKAIAIFKEKWTGLNIIGFRNGYFANQEEQAQEAMYIAEVNPDFLIVGMGAVMQEKFLILAKEKGFKGVGFTCGGSIHQVAQGDMDYYPAWVDKWNLRFVYRFFKERHTRRRYLKAAFVFPARFIFERFFG